MCKCFNLNKFPNWFYHLLYKRFFKSTFCILLCMLFSWCILTLMYAILITFKIKALFGVIYLLESIDMNDVDFDKVFYHERLNGIFQSTRWFVRFNFYVIFENLKIVKPIVIFERRVPFAHMTIDKTLYPYHGRIGFKQSKPSKRIKYGFLCRSLGDSSVQSTYLSLPYAGKP